MTKKSSIPTHLHKNNIGKVVTVQVFKRSGPDTINTNSLEKCVGLLEGYSFNRSSLTIKIRGLAPVCVSRISQYAEVFI